MMFPILEDKKLKELLDRFDGFLVGGYVRDCIIGRDAKDIDVCSIKPPEKIEQLLKRFGYKFRVHGKSYGVFVVQLHEELEIELSAARRDFNQDGRHCQVEFVDSIDEDLARRDLTINSLAVNSKGEIVDPFNGLKDIQKGVVRFVGKPSDRIEEDNLRAFRALRFSYQLGFELLPETAKAIKQYAKEILSLERTSVLSNERIRVELEKILANYSFNSDTHWNCFCLLLASTGLPILSLIGLEHPKKFHEFDVFEHVEKVLRFSPRILKVQLAALLHDIGKADCQVWKLDDELGWVPTYRGHDKLSANLAEDWLRKMTFPNEIVSDVVDLVNYHMLTIGETNKSKVKCVNKFKNEDVFRLWGLLRICDRLGKGNMCTVDVLEQSVSLIKKALTLKEEQPLKLAVSGNDIMKMFNLKPSKRVGELLEQCKELVFEDPANNDREVLLAFLRNLGGENENV